MIRNILYFAVASVLFLLIIELYIRGTEISSVSFTGYEEKIGRIIRPNAKIVYYNENFTYSQINNYGYLGPSYPPKKRGNTFRIALLGDSYVEGFQVLERHHFRTILEENLKEELGFENIEILNFGRSGFGLADAYAYDQNFVSDFNPDLKIYFLSAVDFYKQSKDKLLPKWKLKGNTLVQDTSYRKSTSLKVYNKVKVGLQHSATLQMVRNCVDLIKDGEALNIVFDKFSFLFQKEKINPLKGEEKRNAIIAGKIPQIPAVILKELGKEENVIIVNRDEIQFPNHLHEKINQQGIKLIDLSDTLTSLQARRNIDPRYWPVTDKMGHWNYTGHKAVGEYLGKILSKSVNFKTSKLVYKQ